MSVQSIFSEDAINMLTNVADVIRQSDTFSANQMRSYTLYKILDSRVALASATDSYRHEFETQLLEDFKLKKWSKL